VYGSQQQPAWRKGRGADGHWQLVVAILSKERRGKVSMFNGTDQASRKKD